jgi:hypothetical protein
MTKISSQASVAKTKTPKAKPPVSVPQDEWEIKDRVYIIKNGSPVNYMLRTQHSPRKPLQYNDGTRLRALRYSQNHESPFMDEQDGEVLLGRIRFRNGSLTVRKEDIYLQKFLSVYHPDNGTEYIELNLDKEAQDDLVYIEQEVEAMQLALNMDINDLEAIARAIFRSNVNNMRSSEIKRDIIMFARERPNEFIKLANDENIKNRNIAIRAVEMGILKVLSDNQTVCWNDKEKTKIMTARYGENIYSELARFFKTDEGVEVLQGIANRL